MFGLSSGEILIIALLALLLFGKDELPNVVRKAAKGVSELKKASTTAQRQWQVVKDDVARSLLLEEEEKKQLEALKDPLAHCDTTVDDKKT